jgi:ferritin-like metal-binding protein YciE
MKLNNLHDAFIEEIKDIYNAENQLTKALPKMVKASTDEELKAGLQGHLEETQNQIKRLEQVFKLLGEPAKGKKCEAMEGLIEEGKDAVEADTENDAVRDALIICAAQKVEHYEIATYGSLKSWAEELDLKDVARLLNETLEEEKAADERLNTAAGTINEAANSDDEESEEDAEEPEEEEEAQTR